MTKFWDKSQLAIHIHASALATSSINELTTP